MENLKVMRVTSHTMKNRSRIILSMMGRLGLSVSGIEDYHLFTDRNNSIKLAQEWDSRKFKYAFWFFTLCFVAPTFPENWSPSGLEGI
jgi:hypothetical protein